MCTYSIRLLYKKVKQKRAEMSFLAQMHKTILQTLPIRTETSAEVQINKTSTNKKAATHHRVAAFGHYRLLMMFRNSSGLHFLLLTTFLSKLMDRAARASLTSFSNSS